MGFAVGIAILLAAILGFCFGAAFSAYDSADDLNKFTIPFLSMAGSWVSGIGSLVAVLAALRIAANQSTEQRIGTAVKCAHHAIAVLNDLIARVSYQRRIFAKGGLPVQALLSNTSVIERRYESLFDREIYQSLPGPLIDQIVNLSGSVFGLITVGTAAAAQMASQNLAVVPIPANADSSLDGPTENLLRDLNALLDSVYKFRKELEP